MCMYYTCETKILKQKSSEYFFVQCTLLSLKFEKNQESRLVGIEFCDFERNVELESEQYLNFTNFIHTSVCSFDLGTVTT